MSDPIWERRRGPKRLAAAALSAALLMDLALPALAENALDYPQRVEGEQPRITIETNIVLDELKDEPTGFIELVLKVDTPVLGADTGTPDPQTFSYLAVSLEYDDTILSPATWETRDPKQPGIDPPAGSYTTHLPVKTSDYVSGYADAGAGGLLYFMAESTSNRVFTGAEPLAVLRFAYDREAHPLRLLPDGSMTEDGLDAENPAPLAAPLIQFSPDADAAATPSTGSVGSYAGQSLWYESGVSDTRPKGSAFYYTTVAELVESTMTIGDKTYTYQKPDTKGMVVTAYGDNPDDLSGYVSATSNRLNVGDDITFSNVSKLSYVPGEGISLDDVFVAVMVDWQDKVIGAVPLAKGVKASMIAEKIDAFVGTVFEGYAPSTNAEHPSLVKDQQAVNTTPYDSSGNDARYPLTSKKGYNFAGWALTTAAEMGDLWTAYDTAELTECQAALTDADALAAKTETVFLKAVYVGNEELNFQGPNCESFNRMNYSIGDYSYDIVGSVQEDSGNYSIKFYVSRKNADGYGVSRLKEPGMRLLYTINGVDMYMYVALENEDIQQVEIVAPKGATKFDFLVIEQFGVPTYVTGLAMSNNITMYKDGTSEAGDGYMVEATLKSYLEYARQQFDSIQQNESNYGMWTSVDYVMLCDLGLKNTMENFSSTQATTTTRKEALARNLISLYMLGKGSPELTKAQLVAALSMSTANTIKPTNTGADTYYSKMKNAVSDNINASYGAELTTAQITYVIVNGIWTDPMTAQNAFPSDIDPH